MIVDKANNTDNSKLENQKVREQKQNNHELDNKGALRSLTIFVLLSLGLFRISANIADRLEETEDFIDDDAGGSLGGPPKPSPGGGGGGGGGADIFLCSIEK